MSKILLVGIDDSEDAGRAADIAAEQAKTIGGRLVLAHVIEWSPYSFNTPEENEQRHKRREEEIERAQTQVIEPALAKLKGQGSDVEGVVRHGHAAQVLCEIAQEKGASQIFIGRRGRSRMAALLFGSVAGSLVQVAPIPVTVVP